VRRAALSIRRAARPLSASACALVCAQARRAGVSRRPERARLEAGAGGQGARSAAQAVRCEHVRAVCASAPAPARALRQRMFVRQGRDFGRRPRRAAAACAARLAGAPAAGAGAARRGRGRQRRGAERQRQRQRERQRCARGRTPVVLFRVSSLATAHRPAAQR
jgi:hypothetical protein